MGTNLGQGPLILPPPANGLGEDPRIGDVAEAEGAGGWGGGGGGTTERTDWLSTKVLTTSRGARSPGLAALSSPSLATGSSEGFRAPRDRGCAWWLPANHRRGWSSGVVGIRPTRVNRMTRGHDPGRSPSGDARIRSGRSRCTLPWLTGLVLAPAPPSPCTGGTVSRAFAGFCHARGRDSVVVVVVLGLVNCFSSLGLRVQEAQAQKNH